jgi:phenylacetate-CoA ligase
MMDDLADRERFPTLTTEGQRMLNFLRGHPSAPVFRNTSGNRLQAHEVEAQQAFEREIVDAPMHAMPGIPPRWMDPLIARMHATVPHYRQRGSPPRAFDQVAPVSRADLSADIAQFVPDDVPLGRMIQFRTTGTTGHPLLIPSHPVVAARYAAFHKRALRRLGIEPQLGFQERCFTYVSVTPTMGESGLAKLNLHPNDWRDPLDRARYLDALAPEIVAGDPISFTEYLTLPLTHAPRALISVSMQLMPALRMQLEQRFGCPVLDIYSLGEVGPVGVFDAALDGHLLLQPQLHVEILDRDGRPVRPGTRGEITVTGGFNDCLPLLRYRTGDYASLRPSAHGPVLIGLCGRQPVRYRALAGWINNIDVTHALEPFPLSHFHLHQGADGNVSLHVAPNAMHDAAPARAALERLFGAGKVVVDVLHAADKTLQYTSSLEGSQA